MDRNRLARMIADLKDLVEELECEILSDPSRYVFKTDLDNLSKTYVIDDYDDDGYCD